MPKPKGSITGLHLQSKSGSLGQIPLDRPFKTGEAPQSRSKKLIFGSRMACLERSLLGYIASHKPSKSIDKAHICFCLTLHVQ